MQNAECRMQMAECGRPPMMPASHPRLHAPDAASRFTFHASRVPPHLSRFTFHVSRHTRQRGFSLIEILVTMALLSFIVLGLFAMFNQTQRAFMTGIGQTDILEASRAVTDMLSRELEQLAPSRANAVNFYAVIPNTVPLVQNLPGTTIKRTNYLQDVFILTRQGQTWTGTGYCVRTNDSQGRLYFPQVNGGAGVGSLYRFSTNLPAVYFNSARPNDPLNGLPQDPGLLFAMFNAARQSGSMAISNRLCDGVIHFYVRPFATNGYPLYCDGARTNAWFLCRTNGPNFGFSYLRQASARPNAYGPDGYDLMWTWSNAVPAVLQMEIGILESRTLGRFNSIGNPAAQQQYIQREETSTRVHLFRQRIPIRNVDPTAFQ
jgi:prepilin-type N-terminal cleavage/methylation domain-containing protein